MGSHGQGSIRAASGTTLCVQWTSKMKENERFYGFTDLRGKAVGRGRDGHGSKNQVTAGCAASFRIRLVAPRRGRALSKTKDRRCPTSLLSTREKSSPRSLARSRMSEVRALAHGGWLAVWPGLVTEGMWEPAPVACLLQAACWVVCGLAGGCVAVVCPVRPLRPRA